MIKKTFIKQICYHSIGYVKRFLILLFPMFFVAMLLIDILTLENTDYPDNLSVFIFGSVGALFYLSCLYCIFVAFNKWNISLFLLSCCLLICMIKFNPDIKKIYQHSQCIETITVPCPDNVILGGG